MTARDQEGASSPLDSRNPLYWVHGDPLCGAVYTGRNDPDAEQCDCPDCRSERRIDACMVFLAETYPSMHDHYLARWTMDGTLNAKQFRVVQMLLGRAVA